ncbi:DUF1194 domain-containing protein [Enterovirga aerilata]|uniref:DUF1194 domain-containing protein n=1 Tax=Enterovirga aerilata TaxID=2730920 RepID=A0A849I406_9HYPH|nr:DUF1194 domain-containing protein [Enterovirga sp. DB1703]NNM71095.1 DUF1194 domain-containing protein [Enterovirga sp. DB1703]
MRRRLFQLAGLALAGAALTSGPARAEIEVDLALVIAVDVSFSMDPDEQTLQREGFIEAFRSPIVHDAIRRGAVGRIAVSYMEWAGASDQRILLPWTILEGADTANAFAEALSRKPTRRASRTSISGAIDYSVRMQDESGVSALRRVIDVSGDGPNNQGRAVLASRADAIARGITINGLPVMLKDAGYFDIQDLDTYYRDCVIGGQGAFMVPAKDKAQFRDAVKTKIIMEIAAAPSPGFAAADEGGSLVLLAQETRRANCLAGEQQWRDRMGN